MVGVPFPLLPRLTAKSEQRPGPLPTPCIVWTGHTVAKGYGIVSVRNRRTLVHRAAWAERHGPIPDGLHVLHRCDNPPCWADGHLYLGTNNDNVRDKTARGRTNNGRAARTHCPQGHPYDEANTYTNTRSRRPNRQCRECRREYHRNYRRKR